MNLLAALYGAVIKARNARYDRGALPIRRLQGPVISIGNIRVGGSGKTPFLIMLGQLLQQRGINFDVLSRGYGRRTKGVALVDPVGASRDYGDEPLLIARKLQVPVVIGEDRYAAGQFAEQKFGPQLHLLDDGFQHRQLARDFDIVLVTDGDAKDSLLPVGRLRESVSSLRRADAVVLTNDTACTLLAAALQACWRLRRGVEVPTIDGLSVAFCGIARPDNFFQELRTAGVVLAATRRFRDHHYYADADLDRLLELRHRHNATAFVTTEKDAINLGDRLARLEPVHIATVRMQIEEAATAIDAMLATIAARNRKPA